MTFDQYVDTITSGATIILSWLTAKTISPYLSRYVVGKINKKLTDRARSNHT